MFIGISSIRMKMKLIIFAFASSLPVLSFAALWQPYDINDESIEYFDPISIVRNGDKVRVVTMKNLTKFGINRRTAEKFVSVTTWEEVDCSKMTWRYYYLQGWSERDGKGKLIDSVDTSDIEAREFDRWDSAHELHKHVCK